jgi:hypothetical protein
MDSKKIIDTLVREIALGDELPELPTWPQLKAALAGGTDLFSLDALEARQEEIRESFIECRWEQIQEKKRQGTDPQGHTNGTSPPTPPRSRTPSNSSGSDKILPTLDDAANVSAIPFPVSFWANADVGK